MKLSNIYIVQNFKVVLLLVMFIFLNSCEEEYTLPDKADPNLITYIKRDYTAPLIVNNQIDFVFAIASKDGSSLNSFKIKASYIGITSIDPNCYWTLTDGKTYSREMITGISIDGQIATGSIIDNIEWYPGIGVESGYSSQAVSIRYSYIIPEEARGKNLKFEIEYTTKRGSKYSYSTSDYPVESMDMATDIVMTDPTDHSGKRYFSISEMKAYTLDEVENQNKSALIDFVYRFDNTDISTPEGGSIRLNSCISAPSHNVYLNVNYILPDWHKNSTIIEKRKWDDMHLKGAPPSNYVTDIDILNMSFAGNTFGEYGLSKDFGLIMQTADNKYRAYIYLKNVGTRSITIGIKRLEL